MYMGVVEKEKKVKTKLSTCDGIYAQQMQDWDWVIPQQYPSESSIFCNSFSPRAPELVSPFQSDLSYPRWLGYSAQGLEH